MRGWIADGRVDRLPYALAGTVLAALKYGLDRALAALFDRSWTILDYWTPSAYALDKLPRRELAFFVALVALALPSALAAGVGTLVLGCGVVMNLALFGTALVRFHV